MQTSGGSVASKESEAERLERLSNEEFARTGIFDTSFSIDIKITEEDMIKDLISKTEGKNIQIEKPNNN